MRLQITGVVFLIFLFLNLPSAYSQQFTCDNTANWVSMASNANPYDFYNHQIKPDGSPSSTLDFAQQLDAFYSNNEYDLIVNPDPECYAAVTCTEGTGYNFGQGFDSNHPAWSDSRCSCSHFPQTGCNRVTWHRRGHPNLVSGGVGTPFPTYPIPTYPSAWNERYLYSHTFGMGTTDSTIALNITANINTDYLPTGTSATATKCSEGSTNIGGEEYSRKYYLVNGLANHDQTFNATQPYQEWNENWGHCGKVRQYWTESIARVVSWPSVVKAVPVIAYVSLSGSYEYSDRPQCQEGWSSVGAGHPCWHNVAPSGKTCPDGYTYRYGAFGSSSCRRSEPRSLRSCPTGWEINPANSNQCRRSIQTASVPTDTPPDDETYDGSGSGSTPTGGGSSGSGSENSGSGDSGSDGSGSSGSGSGGSGSGGSSSGGSGSGTDSGSSGSDGSGSGDSGSGSSGSGSTVPPWCTGAGYTWDASTSTCSSPDGGEVVTPTPGDTSGPILVTFGNAPTAGDTTGTRNISSSGFYTPIYGPDTTISSFIETAIAGWNTETLRSRLMTFLPPTGDGALPNTCMTLSIMSGPVCIDLNSYAFVFTALRAFLYLIAGFSAYRIIIGA